MTTRPTPARRRGLFALLVNAAERDTFNARALAQGKGLSVWIRELLLFAADRRADPPDPEPIPLPPARGPRRRGRQALRPEDRRETQIRIGMTLTERSRVQAAAKATGRSESRWARAVLYQVIGVERGLSMRTVEAAIRP